MGLEFEPLKIEYSRPGKAEAKISRDPEFWIIEQLTTENKRLQQLIVELLMKNERLRSKLQDEKSI
jgi:hypothetical protein